MRSTLDESDSFLVDQQNQMHKGVLDNEEWVSLETISSEEASWENTDLSIASEKNFSNPPRSSNISLKF